MNLSYGISEPVFLSKFGYESTYNKLYFNLIPSGVGPMLNGQKQNSFTHYTSLSSSKNSLKVQNNLSNDFELFELPEKLLHQLSINNSYVFLMNYNFYFKDFEKNNFENEY